MKSFVVYKILKDYEAEKKGREPEALYGWTKQGLYEKVFDHINEMNPEELSSVPDNVEEATINTFPEKDIPNFNNLKGRFYNNTFMIKDSKDIYHYSLELNKWIKYKF